MPRRLAAHSAASRLPHADLSILHISTHVVPRFISLPAREGQHAFVLLEDVLRATYRSFITAFEILSCHAIRVTRDVDFGMPRRHDEDLLMTIEQGVRERRMGDAVRLQYNPELPQQIVSQLVDELELGDDDLYPAQALQRSQICSSSTPRSICRGSRIEGMIRVKEHNIVAAYSAPEVYCAFQSRYWQRRLRSIR